MNILIKINTIINFFNPILVMGRALFWNFHFLIFCIKIIFILILACSLYGYFIFLDVMHAIVIGQPLGNVYLVHPVDQLKTLRTHDSGYYKWDQQLLNLWWVPTADEFDYVEYKEWIDVLPPEFYIYPLNDDVQRWDHERVALEMFIGDLPNPNPNRSEVRPGPWDNSIWTNLKDLIWNRTFFQKYNNKKDIFIYLVIGKPFIWNSWSEYPLNPWAYPTWKAYFWHFFTLPVPIDHNTGKQCAPWTNPMSRPVGYMLNIWNDHDVVMKMRDLKPGERVKLCAAEPIYYVPKPISPIVNPTTLYHERFDGVARNIHYNWTKQATIFDERTEVDERYSWKVVAVGLSICFVVGFIIENLR